MDISQFDFKADRQRGRLHSDSSSDVELFSLVDKVNDQPTADVLTQRIDVHEKTAWMLGGLLEE